MRRPKEDRKSSCMITFLDVDEVGVLDWLSVWLLVLGVLQASSC